MSLFPKPISKEWIKKKYWQEEKTADEMAALRKVKPSYIQDLIDRYDLSKKKHGIKIKGKRNYIMPEYEKVKHRVQPHAKEIVVYKGKAKTPIGTYRSINDAANKLGLCRNHIKDCLNPNKARWRSKGYSFGLKKYKGEIIIERRLNLDFTLEFEKVTTGLLAKLPDYPYEERINYYNKKLKQVFNELGY
jgi:hypothetical protein